MARPLPKPGAASQPLAHPEAVSRLATIRHALRLVEPFGGGPAPDLDPDEEIAAAWRDAGDARQRQFDRRSGQLVGAAQAGFEALLAERESSRGPNVEATRALADQIRRELAEVTKILFA